MKHPIKRLPPKKENKRLKVLKIQERSKKEEVEVLFCVPPVTKPLTVNRD